MNPALLNEIRALRTAVEQVQREIIRMQAFERSFKNAAEFDPEIAKTIVTIVGGFSLSLNDLIDVDANSPSPGQPLEWNGTAWAPGTDNI